MASKLGEGRLADVDRNVAIFEAEPSKSGVQNIVNIPHEIDLDLVSEDSLEYFFFVRACWEEDEAINQCTRQHGFLGKEKWIRKKDYQ